MARIVVADDDVDVRALVVFRLERSGYDVTAVGDGYAAVSVCRESPPDLVVLDVMMPGMSGLDAVREMRGDEALATVPVLMLTARAQESDVEQAFQAGADDYVVKPFSPRELLARVTALLGRRA